MRNSICFLIFALSLLITSCYVEKEPEQPRFFTQLFFPASHISLSLHQAMLKYHVPAVSIAIINNYQIVYTRAFGVKQAGTDYLADKHTLFQAGTISQAITAFTVLRLVAQKKLQLDTNINSNLLTWQLPNNHYTQQHFVTLRDLLSMTGGTNTAYYYGYTPDDKLPTLNQILNGAPEANIKAIRVTQIPGENYFYSSGGYQVIQQLLQDITHQNFNQTIEQQVLQPLSMHETFAKQLVSVCHYNATAAATNAKGQELPYRWRIYPELAAAGIWSTPTDLAKFTLAIMQAYVGSKKTLLPKALARAMLAPQNHSHYGLGFVIKGKGRDLHFMKSGTNLGFQAWLIGFPNTGQAAIVMTNSAQGNKLIKPIMRAIAKAYHWPPYQKLMDGDDLK